MNDNKKNNNSLSNKIFNRYSNKSSNTTITNTIKKIAKAKLYIKIIVIVLIVIAASLPILFIAGSAVMLFDLVSGNGFDSESYNSLYGGSILSYDSSCNYEETKVVVMNGAGTKVITTVSLEDYIIGVGCTEIGACDGTGSTIEEHFVKSQYVASKTYALSLGGYNSNTKSITVKASTRNQQWCSLTEGCIVTYDGSYHNTYPGNYSTNEQIIGRHSFTKEDLENFHKYYKEIYGDLFLPTSYNKSVTNLTWNTATEYKDKTQIYWRTLARQGQSYNQILKSTATSGKPDAEDYVGKEVYKLGSYCAYTRVGGSTGNFIDLGTYPNVLTATELRVPINNALTTTDINNLNNYINSNIEKAGHGTGAAVAAAAQSLVSGLYQKGYYLPYWFGGGHMKGPTIGIDTNWGGNGRTIDPYWSSSNYGTRSIYSYDCSGFVSWAIKNGCSSKFTVDATPGFIRNYGKSIDLKNAKPGDIMVFDEGGGKNGHIRVVVKNNGNGSIITAESTSSPSPHGGIQFTTHNTVYENGHIYKIIDMSNWYAKNCENIQPPKKDNNDNGSSNKSSGKGKILLVAGHSYAPYCNKVTNECRGVWQSSGYAEETETRKLVQLIKKKLIEQGYSSTDVDIVNELLGENFNDTSTTKSLFVEIKTNSSSLNKIDFSQYKYGIEIHFNGSGSSAVRKGITSLCNDCPGPTKDIDSSIRNDISSILNTNNLGTLSRTEPYTDIEYLANKGVPLSYLETEYYDNKAAMDIYEANIDKVAEAIAKNIKKYYP